MHGDAGGEGPPLGLSLLQRRLHGRLLAARLCVAGREEWDLPEATLAQIGACLLAAERLRAALTDVHGGARGAHGAGGGGLPPHAHRLQRGHPALPVGDVAGADAQRQRLLLGVDDAEGEVAALLHGLHLHHAALQLDKAPGRELRVGLRAVVLDDILAQHEEAALPEVVEEADGVGAVLEEVAALDEVGALGLQRRLQAAVLLLQRAHRRAQLRHVPRTLIRLHRRLGQLWTGANLTKEHVARRARRRSSAGELSTSKGAQWPRRSRQAL
mmetsp:Transcript_47257/g.120555  ORF Transcript_47257/g.120555 Transcript_47257/m.120555 type:complete len:271 (+) Transcript_47257:1449-2261(+)